MTATAPLRIAVVGAGPAGLYAVDSLLKSADLQATIDVIDRLPTPYGLIRYGVAPDHHKIKSVARALQPALESDRVRFLGCVELGRDLTREDLLGCYHAVIYATGAARDRRLGIPGEDLPGSCSSTDFVNWYSGHPDAAQPFPLAVESVAVIGVGNVAVDVARVLAVPVEHLHPTDVPADVLEALRASTVREVHLIGRRGPEYGKFTTKELRELGELAGVTAVAEAADLPADEPDRERHVAANLAVLEGWVGRQPSPGDRAIRAHFWQRPVEILGSDRVEGIRLEGSRPEGPHEITELTVQAVVRAVGYRSLPLPGVPFDDEAAVVRNDGAGRVIDDTGAPLPGEYVTGWIKRGPTGVIGTNKGDAAETVRSLVADLAADGFDVNRAVDDVEVLLAERGVAWVGYPGWLAIDAEEIARGAATGRPRVKVNSWAELCALGARSGA